MTEVFLPTFDLSFILSSIEKSTKVQKVHFSNGNTYAFLVKGDAPVGKRMVIIRHFNGQVNFEFGIAIAKRLDFLGDALAWLEKNKSFKDGGYIK